MDMMFAMLKVIKADAEGAGAPKVLFLREKPINMSHEKSVEEARRSRLMGEILDAARKATEKTSRADWSVKPLWKSGEVIYLKGNEEKTLADIREGMVFYHQETLGWLGKTEDQMRILGRRR